MSLAFRFRAAAPLFGCLLAMSALAGSLTGADEKQPAGKTAGDEILKGEAQSSVHSYKMQKGNIYRILATGDGFLPQVRIHGQPLSSFSYGGLPPAGRAGNVAQLVFVPRESKVYPICVDYAPGGHVNKGANSYRLSIERARLQSQLPAQERQLVLGENSRKLEQGKMYRITVTGRGFAPHLHVLDGRRPVGQSSSGRWFGFGPDAEHVTTMRLNVVRTADYRLVVAVGPIAEQRQAPLTYTTEVAELKMELSVQAQLRRGDPLYPRRGGPHQLHRVKLEAGKSYQIEMSSEFFDPYLFLEDTAGKLLAQDDDSGGNLNARIIFRPQKSGTYVIVATTFAAGVTQLGLGFYTLTVVQNASAQPGFATPTPTITPGKANGESGKTAESNEELYRRIAPATVLVYKNQGPSQVSAGTGFLIDAGERLVVTARHVIENFNGGLSPFVAVAFAQSEDGEIITDAGYYRKNWQTLSIRGKIVYESVRRDLAIVQLEKVPAGVKALPLAARTVRPAQTVHLVGNAGEEFGGVFGYCQGYARNVFHWDYIGARVVTTQLPTNKGDSGGPMVNNRGEVLGFASMGTTGSQLPRSSVFHDKQVTGVSICVSELRAALDDLRRSKLAGNDKSTPGAVTFKGEARAALQRLFLEKDVMYRIAVKGVGFVPDVRCDNLPLNPLGNAPIDDEWLHLYTPYESKEYRIQIGHLSGRELVKSSMPYTLAVDRVTFEPEADVKGTPLRLNEHVRSFKLGTPYDITVTGRGFEPDLHIIDGVNTVASRYNNGARRSGARQILEAFGLSVSEFETSLRFVPGKSGDFRILVAIGPHSPSLNGKLTYRVHIAERQALATFNGELTAKDPQLPQGGPFKLHTIKLESGKTYQLDLFTRAFDSRILLQDQSGKQVAQGYDAAEFGSSLVFRPTTTAVYRVLVTSHLSEARGPYSLTVASAPPRTVVIRDPATPIEN